MSETVLLETVSSGRDQCVTQEKGLLLVSVPGAEDFVIYSDFSKFILNRFFEVSLFCF